jgi:hypothetical protein
VANENQPERDINGLPFTYENKDELVFEPDPNQPCEEEYLNSIKETASGLIDDLKKIVSLGESLKENKIDYSFRSIFKEEK